MSEIPLVSIVISSQLPPDEIESLENTSPIKTIKALCGQERYIIPGDI